MPEFTSPLALVAFLAAMAALVFAAAFAATFFYHVLFTGQRARETKPRWRPPEDWSPTEVDRMRREVHPRWTPPTVPGQCPICGAMPGKRCDSGLHC